MAEFRGDMLAKAPKGVSTTELLGRIPEKQIELRKNLTGKVKEILAGRKEAEKSIEWARGIMFSGLHGLIFRGITLLAEGDKDPMQYRIDNEVGPFKRAEARLRQRIWEGLPNKAKRGVLKDLGKKQTKVNR